MIRYRPPRGGNWARYLNQQNIDRAWKIGEQLGNAYRNWRNAPAGSGSASRPAKRRRTTRSTVRTPYPFQSSHGQMKGTYKKRRGRLNRRSLKRRKIFAKKVKKVIQGKLAMCCFTETWNKTTAYTDITGGSVGLAGAIEINDGCQLVLGHNSMWALNNFGGSNGPYEIIKNYLANSYRITDAGALDNLDVATYPQNNNVKFLFKTAELNVTIENHTGGANPGLDLIMDVYEFVAAQTIDHTSHNDPVETWNTLQGGIRKEGVTTDYGGIAISDQGQTPLDCPGFGKYWTLVSKKRVVVPWGSDEATNPQTTLKMTQVKPYVTSYLQQVDQDVIKGRTKYMMIIINPDTCGTTYANYDVTESIARIYIQKKYHYKCLGGGTSDINPGNYPRVDWKKYAPNAYNSTSI